MANQKDIRNKQELDTRINFARKEVAENKVIPVDDTFFETAREYVKQKNLPKDNNAKKNGKHGTRKTMPKKNSL